jgi:hypothetical protein
MLSSKSHEIKKLDQKEQKTLLQGIEPESGVYHLQIRSIYGQKFQIRYRIYGVPRIRRISGHTVWANPSYV